MQKPSKLSFIGSCHTKRILKVQEQKIKREKFWIIPLWNMIKVNGYWLHASLAQWQSAGLVNQRSPVQIW